MSLEDKLETLIVKIDALTQVTTELAALRSDAIEAVQKEAAPASKRTSKKSEDKPTETETQTTSETEETPSEPETPKADTLSEAVKEFMSLAGDDKAKRTEIAGIIKGIFGKVKATKRSEVPAEKEAAVEKAIRAEIDKFDQTEETSDDDLL